MFYLFVFFFVPEILLSVARGERAQAVTGMLVDFTSIFFHLIFSTQ